MEKCRSCGLVFNKTYNTSAFEKLCGYCYIGRLRTYVTMQDIKYGCDCGCDGDWYEQKINEIYQELEDEEGGDD